MKNTSKTVSSEKLYIIQFYDKEGILHYYSTKSSENRILCETEITQNTFTYNSIEEAQDEVDIWLEADEFNKRDPGDIHIVEIKKKITIEVINGKKKINARKNYIINKLQQD